MHACKNVNPEDYITLLDRGSVLLSVHIIRPLLSSF